MHTSLRLLQTGILKPWGLQTVKTPKTVELSDEGDHFLAVTPAAGHTGVSSLDWGGLQHSGSE